LTAASRTPAASVTNWCSIIRRKTKSGLTLTIRLEHLRSTSRSPWWFRASTQRPMDPMTSTSTWRGRLRRQQRLLCERRNLPRRPCMYSGIPPRRRHGQGRGQHVPKPWPIRARPRIRIGSPRPLLRHRPARNAVTTACNQITSPNASIQTQTIRSCVQSNGVKAMTRADPGDYQSTGTSGSSASSARPTSPTSPAASSRARDSPNQIRTSPPSRKPRLPASFKNPAVAATSTRLKCRTAVWLPAPGRTT